MQSKELSPEPSDEEPEMLRVFVTNKQGSYYYQLPEVKLNHFPLP